MSDADDIEAIRQRKREELVSQVEAEDASEGREGTPNEPIEIRRREEFSAVVADHDVVLVDFHAEWCGPCQMLAPVVEAVAADSPAAVAKVDIDRNRQIAMEYGVRSVPTLLLFSDGEQVERLVGMQDRTVLSELIDRHAN
ncbi:thioredoxin [Natronorarus salvus]|uniref:thioredoxin n=1 Tax=Natronorarus salvus TaxID=3117733 RepID=UPI002F2662AC